MFLRRTLTIAEFKELLKNKNWHHEQTAGDMNYFKFNSGLATVTSQLLPKNPIPFDADENEKSGAAIITYTEGFDLSGGLKTSTEGLDDYVRLSNFVVIGEDGEKLKDWEIHKLLSKEFTNIDYPKLFEIEFI